MLTQERDRTRPKQANDKEPWIVDREGWTPCLRICINQRWHVFPWSHFLYAEGNGDEVRVAFTTHDVTFKGDGLWSLLTRIQNQKLIAVELSPRADRFDSDGGPAVYDIIVKSVDDK